MVSAKTAKVVYVQDEGKWPPQASVKGVRRAMKAFFDGRRCAPPPTSHPRSERRPVPRREGWPASLSAVADCSWRRRPQE